MTVEPNKNMNWSNLGFDRYETNGYVKYTCKDGQWSSGEWVKGNSMNIDVASVALNYGQSVFEGMKAFRAKDGSVRIFRSKDNARRISHSAEVAGMPPIPQDVFLEATYKAVHGNLEFVPPYQPKAAGGALYIRPLYFGSGPNLILSPPSEFTLLVWVTPCGSLYGAGQGRPKAIGAYILDTFDRAAPMGTGSAKLAGNYAPVFRHMASAKKAGYGITLHLDSKTRTYIDEFSTSNALFIKREGDTVTLVVPQSPSILRSVTTMAIKDIAKKTFGWDVEERPVKFDEVKAGAFVECAAAGTAAALTPVGSISYKNSSEEVQTVSIGTGEVGEHFTRMLQELLSLQCGDVPDTFDACWEVKP